MRAIAALLLLSSFGLAQTQSFVRSDGEAASEAPVAKSAAAVSKNVRAAQLPNTPAPKVWDKKLIIIETVVATTIAFDAYTTVNMHRPCVETNPMLGEHPSSAAVAGLFGGQYAATMLINYYAKKSFAHRRWTHAFWMAPTLYIAGDHLRGAINNYAIGCE